MLATPLKRPKELQFRSPAKTTGTYSSFRDDTGTYCVEHVCYRMLQIVTAFQFRPARSPLEPALIATSGYIWKIRVEISTWLMAFGLIQSWPNPLLNHYHFCQGDHLLKTSHTHTHIKHSVVWGFSNFCRKLLLEFAEINQNQPKLGGSPSSLTLKEGPTSPVRTTSHGTSKTSCFVAKSTKARST